MTNGRSLKFWGIVVAVVALVVFAASAVQTNGPMPKRGPFLPAQARVEKIRPITFEIGQDSPLVKHCAAKIESDNAMLATMMAEMRLDISSGKTFDRDAWQTRMSTTYLTDPVIITEDGQSHPGWAAVFDVLTQIIGRSTYIDAQSALVDLEYLPYGSASFKTYNTKGNDIDFVAHIKTLLAYAPFDDPVRIAGALKHRNICLWEP